MTGITGMQNFLFVVALALFMSGHCQILRNVQRMLSSEGTWTYAPGWQREISIWNYAALIALGVTVKWGSPQTMIVWVIFIIALTLFLGLNHAVSYYKDQPPAWHLGLVLLNWIGTVLGVITLIDNRSYLPF